MKFSNIIGADERIVGMVALADGTIFVATNRTIYQVQAQSKVAASALPQVIEADFQCGTQK